MKNTNAIIPAYSNLPAESVAELYWCHFEVELVEVN